MEEVLSRSKALIYRLSLAYLVFTLCRLAFYLLNGADFVGNSFFEILAAFFWGLWFDTVPVFYLCLPLILLHVLPHPWWYRPLFQKVCYWVFILPQLLACFQNLGDAGYFPFNKKRTGVEVFHLAKDWDSPQLVSYASDFWYLFPICFLILYLVTLLWRKTTPVAISGARSNAHVWLAWPLHVILWTGIVILGLRGGWGLIPLRTFDAGRYVNTTLVPLTINTPFQFICTVEGKDAPSFHYMTQTKADSLLVPLKAYSQGNFRQKNVVIIIVESLGKEYMGFYNGGKGYTPFLDSLCRLSLTFENSFANGTTSMDAPPAIFSGIPHLMEDSYIVSQFNTNTPESIGSLLAKKGYNSSFYHGGKNGTMGFDNFISLCGMGNYYGLDEYPHKEDFDGRWGIFDEPYLQYYAQELNNKPSPFVSAVFTLSSHHPYTVPTAYQNTLPTGSLPIHKSIAYTDLSLRRFFEKASQMPWFKNTLFVITADHTSDSDNPAYQTLLGRYSIPFIFFDPQNPVLKGTSQLAMQQSLLLPSVLYYLEYDLPFFSLGEPAFKWNKTVAVFYSGGSYYAVDKEHALSMDPSGKTQLYDYHADPYLSSPLMLHEKKSMLEDYLKAYLQTAIERLKGNGFGTAKR